ncbi:MAG: CC/Se motif family (seleno)protein [Bacillota bacterium]
MTYQPAVFAGAPQDVQRYREFQVDGLKVYLAKDARVGRDGLKISLWGIGPWKRILVDGLLS